jgi:ADP-ribosylglycohydrolase
MPDYDAIRGELGVYDRLRNIEVFTSLPASEIHSTGYVVDTLEAAIWCFLTTDSYKDCVLRAVDLGGDTDTIACVAGGLSGIAYGYDSIPEEWKNTIVKKEWILELSDAFQTRYLS